MDQNVRLYRADCLDVLRGMDAGSVDAIVTDPPAGIDFMGKEWDSFGGRVSPNAERQRAAARRVDGKGNQPFAYGASAPSKAIREQFVAFLSSVMSECLRVLKPGAYGLVWALPRTSHWTATALEDSGFEIRDRIAHIFGQGFPKGKTCLKPAVEDWWLVRKPAKKGTPLSIDECRIACNGGSPAAQRRATGRRTGNTPTHTRKASEANAAGKVEDRSSPEAWMRDRPEERQGRWPANLALSHHPECECMGMKTVKGITGGTGKHPNRNVYGTHRGHQWYNFADADGLETAEDWRCHPDCPVRLLDEQSGVSTNCGRRKAGGNRGSTHCFAQDTYTQTYERTEWNGPADFGGASRFFYCSKASSRDRGEGNIHPTVKNTRLMQWLIRLIAKQGDIVVDPFLGSGTTGVACVRTGRRFIGIEIDKSYYKIAHKRIAEAQATLLAPAEAA